MKRAAFIFVFFAGLILAPGLVLAETYVIPDPSDPPRYAGEIKPLERPVDIRYTTFPSASYTSTDTVRVELGDKTGRGGGQEISFKALTKGTVHATRVGRDLSVNIQLNSVRMESELDLSYVSPPQFPVRKNNDGIFSFEAHYDLSVRVLMNEMGGVQDAIFDRFILAGRDLSGEPGAQDEVEKFVARISFIMPLFSGTPVSSGDSIYDVSPARPEMLGGIPLPGESIRLRAVLRGWSNFKSRKVYVVELISASRVPGSSDEDEIRTRSAGFGLVDTETGVWVFSDIVTSIDGPRVVTRVSYRQIWELSLFGT